MLILPSLFTSPFWYVAACPTVEQVATAITTRTKETIFLNTLILLILLYKSVFISCNYKKTS